MSQSAKPPTAARYLLDSNILARLSETRSRQHSLTRRAVDALTQSGAVLCITPQNLIEFWNLATRSLTQNGLALPTATACAEVAKHRANFILLPDRADIFPKWEQLVSSYNVRGVDVHDTRLAAVALVYGIENVLTFNARDFQRFSSEGLKVVDPASVPPYSPPTTAATP